MFSTPFPDAFGLDIGDLSIKLVQLSNKSLLHQRPYFNLKNYRSIKLPPGLISNGELQKPEEVRQLILKLLKGTGKQKAIKSPWVVACLPETKSFIKLIELDVGYNDLTADNIIAAAKKHIPFENPDEYYFQWQAVSSQPTSSQILVGAIPKLIADSYTYLLESLGLGVVALEIEAISIARAMISAQKDYTGEARAILDLGATRSSLIIVDKDMIQFSISLPHSGELVTTALMQKLHLTHEEAEKIKIAQGLEYTKTKDKASTVLIEMNEELIKHLQNALKFYYSHFENANKINHITMCGGCSITKRLDKILSSQLKISTRPGKPWKNLFTNSKIEMSDEESLTYATAIGLGLRAADNPFFSKNLI